MSYVKGILLGMAVCIAGLIGFSGCSHKTPVENLYQYNLPNGLKVFAAENHSVPLVYIEIAVRAGAITQTKENAGLFHLYEHMMFKGNSLYGSAASMNRAIKDMGISDWNGTTSVNCVNYFFTIPKDQLENGLAFWNAAIRSPLMDETEFENEKKVVLSEIEGKVANPSLIHYNYMNNRLFKDEPYRTDSAGSSQIIKDATVAQLRDIQSRFYIPSNAALFVGGDIDPKEVYALSKKIFGSWSNNGNKAPANGNRQNPAPFTDVQYAVLPYDKISSQIANIEISFRGPDTDFELDDTYAADYLLQLLSDPDGLFKKSLAENETYQIPDTNYIWSGYETTRANGLFDFGATVLSPEQNLTGRVSGILRDVQEKLVPALADDESLFSKEKISDIARRFRDNDIMTAQTATGLLSTLRFWWLTASPEYYYSYNENVAKVSQDDVRKFVAKYITDKKPLVIVLVNPAVYEQTKDEFARAGYDTITADKAFWWKDAKFAAEPDKVVSETKVPEQSRIYMPGKKTASAKDYALQDALPVETLTLRNGIPVYVQHDKSSKIDTVNIVVRGGISRLTPETSGLEDALFTMMSGSSERYDFAARKTLAFDTQAGISVFKRVAGSALCLSTIDSYLYDVLPVLADGFINPSYEKLVYDNMMTGYRNSLQTMLNDPSSLLFYEIDRELYKNHPYRTEVSVTPDSLQNITVENMKELHKKILDPANMFVVATGCMDAKQLAAELDKTIGTLAVTGSKKYEAQPVPAVTVSDAPVVLTHSSCTGSGYVARVFSSPSVTDSDYIPSVLAADIYSTLMYNVVREQHGACYSPSSSVGASRAPFGLEYLYRLSDPEHFAAYMQEARDYMLQGRLLDSVEGDGSYKFVTIEEMLPSYKNAYIISTYGSQATASGVAKSLLSNLLSFDDMYYSRKINAQVADVTADQIREVFRKYWIESPSQWWVMVGPDFKDRLRFE